MRSHTRSRLAIPGALAALLLLGGCKIVSIEADREARQMRGDSFDSDRYIAGIWKEKVTPFLNSSAIPVAELDVPTTSDFEKIAARSGRQASEGAPWTFVTTGIGTVTSIKTDSPEGTIEVSVPAKAGRRTAILQTGPVIIDNSIRDALPFIQFNDFTGQLAFADVGRSLTARAVAQTKDVRDHLQIGDSVQFQGTLSVDNNLAEWRITPVQLRKVGQETAQ